MGAIWTLAWKDLRLLQRDKVGAFFAFVWPLVYAVFFGVLFAGMGRGGGGAGTLTIAVVNEDGGARAAGFVEELRGEKSLDVEDVASRAEAERLVRSGKKAAYVIVPEGFSEASRRIFWGDPMRLEIGLDPSKGAAAGMVEGLVTARAFQQMQRLFTDRDAMREHAREGLVAVRDSDDMNAAQKLVMEAMLGSVDNLYEVFTPTPATQDADTQPAAGHIGLGNWNPVKIETREVTQPASSEGPHPHSSFAICFPQGIVWGVLACAATFAASLLVERTRGTLPRLLTAPLARWQILAGKAVACFLTTAAVIVLMLILAWLVFGVRPTSLLMLAVAIVSVAVGVIGIMMVFSVLGKTEAAVSGISWAVIVVMAMFGGGMLPLFLMPAWMAPLSNFSIMKWSILALEGAIWRDFTWAEMLTPCGVLLLVGVVGFGIGATAFRCTARD